VLRLGDAALLQAAGALGHKCEAVIQRVQQS
jgi:hypothetical protein